MNPTAAVLACKMETGVGDARAVQAPRCAQDRCSGDEELISAPLPWGWLLGWVWGQQGGWSGPDAGRFPLLVWLERLVETGRSEPTSAARVSGTVHRQHGVRLSEGISGPADRALPESGSLAEVW